LYSPLIIVGGAEHEELRHVALGCITVHHSHHYFGFADRQWTLFLKEDPPRVKPLLYVYRALLTGIHLMRTGRIEANLNVLNDEFRLPQIPDLIARKVGGAEKSTLETPELAFHQNEYHRLVAQLEQEAADSKLRNEPDCRAGLNDLLIRIRLKNRV
jgi:predicted nucleotidyltransferase